MDAETMYLNKIIEAKENNKLAIFVGAGISLSSNTDTIEMLTWKALIEEIKQEIDKTDETDNLKIAQFFYHTVGEKAYYQKIRSFIPDGLMPSKIHSHIFDIHPDCIITTNWDKLLDDENDNKGHFYDIVYKDKYLVRSILPNKLIKMHGDLEHENIIFTEDDYLNYSQKFPLIENYIKSILSTHVVLFLGYSYNDINLKFIMQWLKKNAKEQRLDMYLTVFESDANQIKYLSEYGITTIILNDINSNLDGISAFAPRSKMVYTFLDRILKGIDTRILKSSSEVIEFVLKKLSVLSSLKSILFDQVQEALTNCSFVFDDKDSLPVLQFHNQILTGDYNRDIRDIYQKFVEILIETTKGKSISPEIASIFNILKNAGIKGIMLVRDEVIERHQQYINISHFVTNDFEDNSYLDFNFCDTNISGVNDLLQKSFILNDAGKEDEALKYIEEVITEYSKNKEYILLFIAFFNYNFLLQKLKHGFWQMADRPKYEKLAPYDMEVRFENLTKELKTAVYPIYGFVDFSFIYKYSYSIRNGLKEIEDAKQTIESSGFVIRSNVLKYAAHHRNLVEFVLKNKLMVEEYSEYRSINRDFVKISIIRQGAQKEKVVLSKIEVYSCIKYFEFKDLFELLRQFFDNDSKNKRKLQLESDIKYWLANVVLRNLTETYIATTTPFTVFEHYIQNALLLLSLTENNLEENESIISCITHIINEKNNTMTIFESANLFFGIQSNLYNKEFEKNSIINLLKVLIGKIANNNYNMQEYTAITQNKVHNIYGYLYVHKIVFDDVETVKNLINTLSTESEPDKIKASQYFLPCIYQISNDEIKSIIKDFILSININAEQEDYSRITFLLSSVMNGIQPLSDTVFQETETFINKYTQSGFNSILFTVDQQLDDLIINKKIDKLRPLSDTVKTIIQRYRNERNPSIF
jgi:NAD-dependent SIR2 family protein deacetylase